MFQLCQNDLKSKQPQQAFQSKEAVLFPVNPGVNACVILIEKMGMLSYWEERGHVVWEIVSEN